MVYFVSPFEGVSSIDQQEMHIIACVNHCLVGNNNKNNNNNNNNNNNDNNNNNNNNN